MSYVNTGVERAKTLTIDKKVSGQSMANYPKQYSILAAFTIGISSYGVLTETEFRRLSNTAYLERLNAFKNYIQAAEGVESIDNVTESGYEAYRVNETNCPIGGEE